MKQNNRSGVTLIELMLASALLAIVIGIATIFMRNISSNYFFSMSQYQLTDEATFTAREIVTELRQVQEAMNGSYALEILDDNEIAFYADINNDGSVERHRYYLENSTLKHDVVNPAGSPPAYDLASVKTTVVVENIDQTKLPLFFYYNDDWPNDQTNNPLSYWQRPLETRLIKVIIPVFNQNDMAGRKSFAAEATVSIRNLKDNYE